MTDHKDNPAEIYLVPDAEHGHAWSDDPAPGEGMREEDATRYVRADLVPASNEVLANSIAELTRKNSELMAQVEQLRNLLIPAARLMRATGYSSGWHETADEISEAIDATPAQHLAEIKAQAVEVFYKALMRSPNISVTGKEIISGIWLCSPVRELSQQAKGE